MSVVAMIDWRAGDHDAIVGHVDRNRMWTAAPVSERCVPSPPDGCRASRDATSPRPVATSWRVSAAGGPGRAGLDVIEELMAAGILVYPGACFGPAGGGCVRLRFGEFEDTWPDPVDAIACLLDGLRR